MTVEEATANFPKEAGIARYGEPEEIAELMAFLVSPAARWMHRLDFAHGRRRGEVHLTSPLGRTPFAAEPRTFLCMTRLPNTLGGSPWRRTIAPSSLSDPATTRA